MQYDESATLGERLLNQALRALGADPKEVTEAQWEKLLRENTGKTRLEILADIGLGKRLNIVVARQLLAVTEITEERKHAPMGPITIRGTEGMAVQYARCCRPIPGDPIIGFIKRGQGLVIHTHDCPAIAKKTADADKWLDVEWDPDAPKKPFDVNIKLVVANQRGVLAKVAAAIADAGSNIDNVSMEEEDGSAYTTMNFTLQVENRIHLANVMRSLRKIQEVVRITRVKG
jgi:GTP pyrophosphokinase